MDEASIGDAVAMNRTTVERTSEREVVVTRAFDAPVHLVFEAWANPEALEAHADGSQVLDTGAGYAQLRARDGGQPDERPHLDVIRADAMPGRA